MRKTWIGLTAVAAITMGAGVSAQTELKPEVTQAAQCSGKIIGNAILDFSTDGNEERFANRIFSPTYVYLSAVVAHVGSSAEAARADEVQQSAIQELIQAHESQQWSQQTWEDLVACYEYVIAELPVDMDERVSKIATDVTDTSVANVKALLQQ